MRVGLTYDLKDDYLQSGFDDEAAAEFDQADTVDAIADALGAGGYETDRIGHIQALTKRLAAGDRWDLVFNIAEGVYGIGREAQVPALLDAYRIPYTFSDPLVLSLTLDKAMTKRVVRDLGVSTPPFAVVRDRSDIDLIDLAFPLFAKPVGEGTGKGISEASTVHNRDSLRSVCRNLLERFRQPVLVERFLPGREFTVGILGTGAAARAIGVLEIELNSQAEKSAYSYQNKKHYQTRVSYRLAKDLAAAHAADTALSAWRGLGCRDAGRIDLRADERGIPNFIEVNPLAGLNPIDSDLPILCRHVGMNFQALITAIMDSALQRVAPQERGENRRRSAAK